MKKSKKQQLEEARLKIKQLRAEALNPELREERLAKERSDAEYNKAKAKYKLEEWMMMKILKGEWTDHGNVDLDRWADECSKFGQTKFTKQTKNQGDNDE